MFLLNGSWYIQRREPEEDRARRLVSRVR
jgi:hypothetical protein